jgi:outer membrane protein assembly factor BamA
LRYFRVAVLFFLLSLTALAQNARVKQFPLEQINVNGSHRYPEEALIAATGLRPGQQTTQAELEQISANLGNSGLFDLVEFRFGWGAKGVVATFNVTDSTKLVPIGFENLVWFSPNELATAVKKKLPLFTGVVPLAGDYKDQIARSLQRILADHNLHGTVTAMPQGAAGQIQAMLYQVEGHDIIVVDCDFPGAEHANKLELSELAKFIMASRYEKSVIESTLQSRLRDIYAADAYLNSRSDRPVLKIVSSTSDRTEIVLTTRVNEGQQYKFSGVHWTGNTLYSSADLTKALKFEPGQAASLPKFRKALSGAKGLYQRVGYLGVSFDVQPTLSADATATFDVNVSEGDQYSMGSLKFTGVDSATADKAAAEWKLKSGAPYDVNYPFNFMAHFSKYVPNTRWQWRNQEVIHDDTRTVDVQIEVETKK